MLKFPGYEKARDLLLANVQSIGTENIPLPDCTGRILAEDLVAQNDVPAFDRTPYDGYAFRAADTSAASPSTPVTLKVLEEIPAGGISHVPVIPGTAVKVLTGAPIPAGADAVIKYELTEFTEQEVTLFDPVCAGNNIVLTGEDVKKGSVLARRGLPIDAGTAGTLAAQGVYEPVVFRKLRVAVFSTGNELVEPWAEPQEGMIRNQNAYTILAALKENGFDAAYLGIARDTAEDIARLIEKGLQAFDAVISTGGVSVGDYDMTPAAMDLCGIKRLAHGVRLKPGQACGYGVRDGKLMCGLSGNPASCMANLYTVAMPALRKMAGWKNPIPELIDITVMNGFPKKSKDTRVLRGRLRLASGRVEMEFPPRQGNVILSATVGCDAMVIIPAGSGPVEPGTILKGFLV